MRQFSATDTFNVSGRGMVKVVDIPSSDELPNRGEFVKIDGEVFRVRGVEIARNGEMRSSCVGLVVTGVRREA